MSGKAYDRIKAERARQISAEGYDAAHDDAHVGGELLVAARIYFYNAGQAARPGGGVPSGFPWHPDHWRPKGLIRDLERAGALALELSAEGVRA